LNHTRPYDGIVDAVRACRPQASVAVLTNKPLRPSEEILGGLALRELFDDVLGGDGPWPRKPDPRSLLALIERAGAAPATTLLVGDSPIDRETARRASVRCCLVSYGFGYQRFSPDQLTGDEWIVPDTRALADVIRRFTADA
jgi:phosphoglycolate phosphatase